MCSTRFGAGVPAEAESESVLAMVDLRPFEPVLPHTSASPAQVRASRPSILSQPHQSYSSAVITLAPPYFTPHF